MTTESGLARLVWQFGEPVHAVTYFAPETRQRTDRLGLKGGWMSYFGCRAAPLGPVVPAVVCAAFYNFHPGMVHRAIPDAWGFASPQQLLDARLDAIDEALRRLLGDAIDSGDVRRAADLARAAIDDCDFAGRPLGAANAALAPPSAAHLSLWQCLTAMREHRGDGHVAALAAAGIGGREANVLQTAAGLVPGKVFKAARHYDDAEWDSLSARLIDRGLVGPDGKLTARGEEVRADVEDRTDRLALTAYDALDDDQLLQFLTVLAPLARAVIATGDIPEVTPVGNRFES
jgi:hypothetical protein